jgi:hypothetical protein
MLKKALKFIIYLCIILIIIGLSLFTISTESPYQNISYYDTIIQQIAQSQLDVSLSFSDSLQIGWSRQNITPKDLTPLAGYGIARGKTKTIHDSIYVSVVLFSNHQKQIALISYDLLIVPPLIVSQLRDSIAQLGLSKDNLFFTATHTHHSIGGWSKGFAGYLMAGGYDEKLTQTIVRQTLQGLREAQKQLQYATIGFDKVRAEEFVDSRLHEHQDRLDAWVRYLKIRKSDGKNACLFSYSAHATCTDGLLEIISRDYTGVAVDFLETKEVQFAIFSAGMVASHTPRDFGLKNDDWTRQIGQGIAEKILEKYSTTTLENVNQLSIHHIPVAFGESNLRLSQQIKLRDWAFRALYPDTDISISVLQIGNIIWLGMPCDFSGEFMVELEKLAEKKGKKLIITSFNGGYMGYITPEQYDSLQHYETREMNWLGKKGNYFKEIIELIIGKL